MHVLKQREALYIHAKSYLKHVTHKHASNRLHIDSINLFSVHVNTMFGFISRTDFI